MQRSLIVRGASVADCVAVSVMAAIFVVIPIATYFRPAREGWAFLDVLCGVFGIPTLIGLVQTLRKRVIAWIADDRSVRMERRGATVWECRWEDFGGWRRYNLPWFKLQGLTRHEVIDRGGLVVGWIDIAAHGPGDVAFFRRTLDLNTPEGGPTPGPLPAAKSRIRTTHSRCWMIVGLGVALWLIGSGCHWMLFTRFPDPEAPDPSLYRILIPLFLYGAGAIGIGLGLLGTLRLSNPTLFDSDGRMPVHGPTLSQFLLDRPQLKPVELVEGKMYAYVNCDNRREVYEKGALSLKSFRFGCFAPLLFFTVPIGFPTFGELVTAVLIVLGTLGAFYLGLELQARRFRTLARMMQERIRLVGNELIVSVGNDERRYPWSSMRKAGTLRARDFMMFRYRFEGPPPFAFDPRYLVEMPSQADIAEMKEMRDRIEADV